MLSQAIDVTDINRFKKLITKEKFLKRICVESELDLLKGKCAYKKLALVFAAKESVLKAIGTGLSGGASFKDIEYNLKENTVKVRGVVGALVGERVVLVSTSAANGKAFAFCVIH